MRKLWVLVMIVALVGAGCGSDDDEEATSGAPPVELSGTVNHHGSTDVSEDGSEAEVELVLDDFYFGPTYVKVAPGQTVTFEIENEGDAQHTFIIDDLDVDEAFASGTKGTVTVTVPDSGSVTFYCRFHKGRGMQGALYTGLSGAGGEPATTTTGRPVTGY